MQGVTGSSPVAGTKFVLYEQAKSPPSVGFFVPVIPCSIKPALYEQAKELILCGFLLLQCHYSSYRKVWFALKYYFLEQVVVWGMKPKVCSFEVPD